MIDVEAIREALRNGLLLDARAAVSGLLAEVDDLTGIVKRVEDLLDDPHDPYVHTHPEGEGEPDCAACWMHDIRYAIDGAE